ncbi:helix-turn-helix domain-containing protein [Longirhabdus pacifica]|uniref:helix-turn-helix domain-containing protein n=1 Tax=Longirhabdus pacifica TaxID=2305227 RepID=UPI0013E8AFE9|nr:helix-turn-helix transcriptional regulator [Longirhabdus pacifica]
MVKEITSLGELVRNSREQQGLTLHHLQTTLGVNKGVISKLENGSTKRPEWKTVMTITNALHIPMEQVIHCYVEVEERPTMLLDLLEKALHISHDTALITKVALAYLESPRQETEEALSALYQFTNDIEDQETRLLLYQTMGEYARTRGGPPFIAKNLVQAYFIKRLDIQRDHETYEQAKEIFHYVDFLNNEEQREFYFKLAIQTYAIKKYEECIALVETGVSIPGEATELEARAYGTMINCYFLLGQYSETEEHLNSFRKYKHQYDVVDETINMTYALIKVKQKEYDTGIPMLERCYKEIRPNQKINVIIDLFPVYIELNDLTSIQQLILKENEFLPKKPVSHQYKALGKYYLYKGQFELNQGRLDNAMECYNQSVEAFTHVGAQEELTAAYVHIMSSSITNILLFPQKFK